MSINVEDLIDKLVSHALSLGVFDVVNRHEPKAAPGHGLLAAIWSDSIKSVPTSGLAITSALVTFNLRIYTNMLGEPEDVLDENLVAATDIVMASLTADLDLGGDARDIDLLGEYGKGLFAQAGYLNQDNKLYRVMTIHIPIVVNDAWGQALTGGSAPTAPDEVSATNFPFRPHEIFFFGSSYYKIPIGVITRDYSIDAYTRSYLGVPMQYVQNHAVTGAKLIASDPSTGGFARVLQAITRSARSAPYPNAGHAYFLHWGHNDLGTYGSSAQVTSAFIGAYRAVIARIIAAAVFENSDSSVVYSGGSTVTPSSDPFFSGTSYRSFTTVGNTLTITLPSDFLGGDIDLGFIGRPGLTGGSMTFTGTASVLPATVSTSNVVPASASTNTAMVARVKGLTSADAGKTIIGTVSALDAGGEVDFDYWSIEATDPPSVYLATQTRLTSAGYAGFSIPYGDSEVLALNALIRALATEFDTVTTADFDAAINKTAAWFASDGVHLNEDGAQRAAKANFDAVNYLAPRLNYRSVSGEGATNLPLRRGHAVGNYYTVEGFSGFAASDVQFTVAGAMFGHRFTVTETERWDQLRVLVTALPVGGTQTLRFAAYTDFYKNYPQWKEVEFGTIVVPTTGSLPLEQTLTISTVLDPGDYWLYVKADNVPGTGLKLQSTDKPVVGMPLVTTAGFTSLPATGWGRFIGGGGPTGTYPGQFPTGAALQGNIPLISLRRA
jgi:hypothetical protein